MAFHLESKRLYFIKYKIKYMNKTESTAAKSRFKLNPQDIIPQQPYIPNTFVYNPDETKLPVTYANTHRYSQYQQIPFQATRIQYQNKEIVEKVPVQKIVFDYKAIKKTRSVPKQKTIIDYYAVQKQVVYIPQLIPQTKIEYVPIQVQTSRIQYRPYSRQIIHMPQSQQQINYTSRPASSHIQNYYSTPTKKQISNSKGIGLTTEDLSTASKKNSDRKDFYQISNTSPVNKLNKLESSNFDFQHKSSGIKLLQNINKQRQLSKANKIKGIPEDSFITFEGANSLTKGP